MTKEFYYFGENITEKFLKVVREYEKDNWLSQKRAAAKLRVSTGWFQKNYSKYLKLKNKKERF